MRSFIIISVFFVFFSLIAYAQSGTSGYQMNASNTKAVYFGKTARIDAITQSNKLKTTARKRPKGLPPNFFGRHVSKIEKPELEHLGPDPLRQLRDPKLLSAGPINLLVNQNGLSSPVGSPTDPTGAIGQRHYVQGINATFVGVYHKDGALIEVFDTDEVFWENINLRGGGDPIILYDAEYHKWVITEFAPSPQTMMLIAVSEDDDPLGVYNLYAFATPSFPDYPKYGIWNNALVVTTNEDGLSVLHQYFIEREALMEGNRPVRVQRVGVSGNEETEAGFYVTSPVNWQSGLTPGNTAPMTMKINDSSWGEVSQDQVELFSFDIDFDNVNNSSLNVTRIIGTPFDSYPCAIVNNRTFSCVPQLGGSGLDAIPEVIMNVPQYRKFNSHESVVLSFITDVTDGENIAGIRWMELQKRGDQDWVLYQEGTYSPDNLNRFMPSISIDADGNIAMGYNVSSDTTFVGMRVTGRLSDDPLGVMTFDETEVVCGVGSIVSGTRFGDYAQMTVDPVDGQTFWYTGEYAGNTNGRVATRITSFKLGAPRLTDLLAASILSPSSSATLGNEEVVTAQVVNVGQDNAKGFAAYLLLDGDTVDTFARNTAIPSGDTVTFSFSKTLNLQELGEYELTLLIDGDVFEDNNRFVKTVRQLLTVETGLAVFTPKTVLCNNDAPVPLAYRVSNFGFDTLKFAEVDFFFNDVLLKTEAFAASIERGQSILVLDTIEGLTQQEGNLEFKLNLKNPNGVTDPLPNNNVAAVVVQNPPELTQLSIRIIHDLFPDETTWEITDGADVPTVLSSGGPFSPGLNNTVTDFACVLPRGCYRFRMLDSFGDGIENGAYEVTDAEGNILVAERGNFVNVQETDFCIGGSCNLAVEVSTVNAGPEQPGSILVEASGGLSYQFSIDGGLTFQESPIFNGLEEGTYSLVVDAGTNCQFSQSVEVILDPTVGLDDLSEGQLVIAPNPTEGGIFSISLTGYTHLEGFLEVHVLNSKGQLIQKKLISRYGDTFKGKCSLYNSPSGLYFVRIKGVSNNILSRVIKK